MPPISHASNLSFSVLVVTYNSSDFIELCLGSLFGVEGVMLPFEVIVVDNASSDGTAADIKKTFPQVNLLRNDTNRGYGAAVNQAAAIATGAFLVVLNPDTV